MPLHDGPQLEEHHAVRRDAGMFDLSRMRAADIDGARPGFLRRLRPAGFPRGIGG